MWRNVRHFDAQALSPGLPVPDSLMMALTEPAGFLLLALAGRAEVGRPDAAASSDEPDERARAVARFRRFGSLHVCPIRRGPRAGAAVPGMGVAGVEAQADEESA